MRQTPIILGQQLKKLRIKKGMSAKQLAKEIYTYPNQIYRWESEEAYPQLGMVATIADYFHVSLDYLVFGEEKKA